MGITNLLQFIKDAGSKNNVREIQGATVAVDAYSWLHKGVFACADKLARGEDTDMFVKYCLKYISMLHLYKVKVIMVFDGRHLPAKEATEDERRKKRDHHKLQAVEMLILERGSEAQSHLRQSIDVTHKMALEVMKACRAKGVDCIVAPFEADAQMAFLNINGFVDYIITEDSDLLVFGAKKVLYKLDLTGNCTLIERSKLAAALKVRDSQFSDDKFRYMCVLAGSDYWPGIKGMGLKKAKEYVFSVQDPDFENALKKMRIYVKGLPAITPQIMREFQITNLMFLYQPVFDPQIREVIPLTPINDPKAQETVMINLKLKNLQLPPSQAFQLALGNLDPLTLKCVDTWSPVKMSIPDWSIWSQNYVKPHPHIIGGKKTTARELAIKSSQPLSSKSYTDPPKESHKATSSLPENSDVQKNTLRPSVPSIELDLLLQYSNSQPSPSPCVTPMHATMPPVFEGNQDTDSAIVQRRSRNPFSVSREIKSESPDYRSLQSGLNMIVQDGSGKRKKKRYVSPWFNGGIFLAEGRKSSEIAA